MSELPSEKLDFDSFLTEVASDADTAAAREKQRNDSRAYLWQTLEDVGINTLIASDEDEQVRRIQSAVYGAHAALESIHPDADKSQLRDMAISQVKAQIDDELFLFHTIEAFYSSSQVPDFWQDNKKVDAIAMLIAQQELSYDSLWIVFANKVIPGDDFDSTNFDHELLVVSYREELERKSLEKSETALKLEGLYSMAVLTIRDLPQEISIHDLYKQLILVAYTNSASAANAEAERRARFDELMRTFGVSAEKSLNLFAYLNKSFPLVAR